MLQEAEQKQTKLTGTQDFDGEKQPVRCEFCGAERRYKPIVIMGINITSILLPCDCPGYKAEQARQQAEQQAAEDRRRKKQLDGIKAACGIPLRYRDVRLDELCVDKNNSAAIAKAKELADNFGQMLPGEYNPAPIKNGLFICGNVGTGKTCLASAIANVVLQNGYSVRFTTMIDLLSKLMDAINSSEGMARISNDYKTAQLLVIDDLGKEPAKEWGTSKIFDILNSRCENCLPTIITTNYSNEEIVKHLTPHGCSDMTIANSITDRIREMCRLVVLAGDSRRGR